MAQGAVPIRESVGAALRFSRENLRFIVIVAALGAVATTLISAIGIAAPALVPLVSLGTALVQTFVYAAFTGCALFGAPAVRNRWPADGGRVWAAMVVIAFLMFIVLVVVTIPVMIMLMVGPLASYVPELTRAGRDEAAVMAVMTRFVEEKPGAILAVMLFYAAIWFVLTSRLYLAAPATVDQRRILTFETWAWTKGATLRIIAARLMLLLPANILVGALGYLIGRLVGVNTLSPGAAAIAANPLGLIVYTLVASFITYALYLALEAGLSTSLYQGLKPAAARTATRGSTDL